MSIIKESFVNEQMLIVLNLKDAAFWMKAAAIDAGAGRSSRSEASNIHRNLGRRIGRPGDNHCERRFKQTDPKTR